MERTKPKRIRKRSSIRETKQNRRRDELRKGSGKPEATSSPVKPPVVIKARRLWLYRLIGLVVMPVMVLVLLECSLRVVGYGYSSSLVHEQNHGSEGLLYSNQKYAWRFFSPSLSREFAPFTITPKKPDRTYRIFVLGASAAQGTPDGAYSFSRILQRMLQHAYPDLTIEVINTAMPAINSHVVLGMARECVQYEPDLFIVYLGNNEVVGPFGAGTVFSGFTDSRTFIRLQIVLKSTRLGQLIKNMSEKIAASNARKEWSGLQMFMDHQVAYNDQRMDIVYSHFQKNLEEIVSTVTEQGVPLVLCTVASNLKHCPPFASLHDPGLSDQQLQQWQSLYDKAVRLQEQQDFSGAIEAFLAAIKIDNQYAELHFRLGMCYWFAGQVEQAKRHIVLSRDYDSLRFRADSRINEIIRSVANDSKQTQLLDIEAIFAENCQQGLPGQELFWEHVHMNFHGNYTVAKACQREIVALNDLKRAVHHQVELTESQCKEQLAYSDWDKHRLIGEVIHNYYQRPPFNQQIRAEERIDLALQLQQSYSPENNPNQKSQTISTYDQAIQKAPKDWFLYWKQAHFYEDHGDFQSVLEACENAKDLVPHNYEILTKMGLMYGQLGDLKKARECIGDSLQSNPYYVPGHFNMAFSYQLAEDYEQAEKHYQAVIQYMPSFEDAYINLSYIAYKRGNMAEAIRIAREGIDRNPDTMDLRTNLAGFLELAGFQKEAIAVLNKALELDPDHQKVLEMLKRLKLQP